MYKKKIKSESHAKSKSFWLSMMLRHLNLVLNCDIMRILTLDNIITQYLHGGPPVAFQNRWSWSRSSHWSRPCRPRTTGSASTTTRGWRSCLTSSSSVARMRVRSAPASRSRCEAVLTAGGTRLTDSANV